MALHNSNSDESLLRRLPDNDEAAFTELYQRYWKRLFAVAANKLGELSSAEEIVQDIFTDLWLRRSELYVNGTLKAYLSAALKYKIIDFRLKQGRRAVYAAHTVRTQSGIDAGTEQVLRFEELRDRLTVLVRELPDKCRLVYHLSKEEGYSHKQIASQLHISEKTVEYHLSRALKALRAGLSQFFTLLW